MAKLRGLPKPRSVLALVIGALIVPFALMMGTEVSAATACLYWSLAVAIPIAASVIWAYTQLAVEALAERFG